jgi:hypothetical protein
MKSYPKAEINSSKVNVTTVTASVLLAGPGGNTSLDITIFWLARYNSCTQILKCLMTCFVRSTNQTGVFPFDESWVILWVI